MKYTKKSAEQFCLKLLRQVRKTGREMLHYPWYDSDGRLVLTDGYRIYRLNPGFIPDSLAKEAEEGKKLQGERIDTKKVFRPFVEFDAFGETETIETPRIDAAKEAYHWRKVNAWLVDFGPEYPMLNCEYAYDAVRLFPEGTWRVLRNRLKRTFSPVYVSSEAGDMLLFPVRSQQKMDAAKKMR